MPARDRVAPRPPRSSVGARLAGRLLLITGVGSLVAATAAGSVVLAPTHGAWRTIWLIFSAVGLSGQATAPTDPQTRLVVALLGIWLTVAFLLITVGVLALWRSR